MKRAWFLSMIVAALATMSSLAAADDTVKPAKARGPIVLGEVKIKLKPQRPLAVADIAKVDPKMSLAQLRQPLVNRIEAAVGNEPF